ncbi:peptidylprolyl isomerase [Carboxylicivirga sp. M1479]|uniref:peptidylprolyl isomerase n=1 Tax=Carboxylicivirga sp. M1479 TaxID=2594476 RepID=UPI0011789A6E|nr:peptidylprolyl isomerase [Carboxylicivirga sp. M1479]TRX65851.1 peptidylprolyl isomerase [Carboxylicivirga sp. M1479]
MKATLIILIMSLFLMACQTQTKVKIDTAIGTIVIELDIENAPVTANNFLKYVDDKRFDGACFYRVVDANNQPQTPIKIDVIQGGLFEEDHRLALSTIAHETTLQTGILHKNGTISMARLQPGSASSEFFICIGDQPELDFGGQRNPDGQGFAAFGRVIKGMDVVKKIQSLDNTRQMLNEPVKIETIRRQ